MAARKKRVLIVPPMTEDDMERLIERVSTHVITETFRTLGINVKDEKEVAEYRRDIEYGRAWRLAVQRGTRMSMGVAITVIVTGFFAMIAMGVKSWVFH